jgi:polar amino acid transport system substrate-binding protein
MEGVAAPNADLEPASAVTRMRSVPDFDSLNSHHPGQRLPDRILPPDESFVQLSPSSSTEHTDRRELELSDILDVPPIQSLLNDFHAIAHIPMAVIDISGRVLAGVGWQEICADFHRVHPETCKNCIESDTQLSAGVPPGEYKLYRCKNNMWDFATPLVVDGLHIGNIFTGQFFFDDEPLDYAVFREQARRYNFDEQRYLDALDKVPRLSRETVNRGMSFLIKLAQMVSSMGFSNLTLTKALAERKRSQAALIRSEKLASAGRMAATVAHEINNPLEAVMNCVYIVANSPELAPELKEHLETAERELHRVAHITQQTLGFYRENTKPAAVDIRTLVDEVVGLYRPKLRQKKIELRIKQDGQCTVLCVAGEIRQVVSNLLVNAIDASEPSGTVNIRIQGCPVKSRTESIGCRDRVSRCRNQMLEVPVEWAFSRKALG